MNVIKRDERIVEFDKTKVYNAIIKAFEEVDNNISSESKRRATSIANYIEELDKTLSVEEIQDIVEEQLMKGCRKDVARAYILYRYMRDTIRNNETALDKEINALKDGSSDELRNNANKDGKKIQTLKPMIADVTVMNYARRHLIPKKFLKHHSKEIYIHDENYFGLPFFNCCLINWEECLNGGMIIGNAPIEKPTTITVAINLLSQIIAHVSSNCYGGVTLINMTKGLCQYGKGSLNKWRKVARKYNINEEEFAWDMLENEVLKATKGLEYEILTLTNSRGEIPFSTIELDCIDLNASEEDQRIQHCIITNMLKVRLEGLTGGITPVFPKLVFELKDGNNLKPTDKYYDVFELAVKCSSIRLYPDYLMHDKLVEVTGGYKAPMSCRSFIPTLYNDNGDTIIGGGFNLGVCSINLARLAIQSDKDENRFYELLSEYLDMSRDILLLRRSFLVGIKANQAPILYQYGAIDRLDANETIDKLLFSNRSTISIGYVGLTNALKALYGKSYDTDINMVEKGVKVLQYMRDYCDKTKAETNIGFSLYSTPAETLSTKFCKEDVKDYGILEGVNDNEYYENSFHFPSNSNIECFDKIDLESMMSKIPSGGAIQYCEFPEMKHNTDALLNVITYAYDKTHYYGVNVCADRCLKCGYEGRMITLDEYNSSFECPQCGNTDNNTLSVIRRLCGYLGSLSERPTIDGKMKEISHRVLHSGGSCGE